MTEDDTSVQFPGAARRAQFEAAVRRNVATAFTLACQKAGRRAVLNPDTHRPIAAMVLRNAPDANIVMTYTDNPQVNGRAITSVTVLEYPGRYDALPSARDIANALSCATTGHALGSANPDDCLPD